MLPQVRLSCKDSEDGRSTGASLRKAAALAVISLTLSWPHTTLAQGKADALEAHPKSEVKGEKLEIELAQPKAEGVKNSLVSDLLLFVTGAATTLATILAARWARLGGTDQAVHERRLELYPPLVKETSRFALYFPRDDAISKAWVVRDECRAMGRAMSAWYFEGGGLLLSEKARDAYFQLARALTRASLAKEAKDLSVPKFPDDAVDISRESVHCYQKRLRKHGYKLNKVDSWLFGTTALKQEAPDRKHLEFKDYVFLQRLSSRLRTQLASDLRGRRRPA